MVQSAYFQGRNRDIDAENRPMYMGEELREWGREMNWEIKTATYIYYHV